MKTETWLAFIFGVVFLLISIVFALVAFYLPKPPNPGVVENFLFVMQVILAISASGVAAVIPGFLNVTVQKRLGTLGTIGIRAGGAIAVFVIIFYVNPRSVAIEKMNMRVGFDEILEKCLHAIPPSGTPLPGAVQYCQDALRFDPTRWESDRQIARIYYWFFDYDNAIAHYKKAISLLVGKSEEEIRREDVKADQRTEFSLMESGISMALFGLANATDNTIPIRLQYFKASMVAANKALWFVEATDSTKPPNTEYTELLYLRALLYASIWIVDNDMEHKGSFDVAVRDFHQVLQQSGVFPQWIHYHLACLYVLRAQRLQDGQSQADRSTGRAFLIDALNELLSSTTAKLAIQYKLMKCRLQDSHLCPTPRGPEPILCPILADFVRDDREIQSIIAQL